MQTANSTFAFECPVCFERYNDSNYAPKALPCGHSCCLKCANDLFVGHEEKSEKIFDLVVKSESTISRPITSLGAGYVNSITCPICRDVSQINPSSLPTNYGILNAMPTASIEPTPPVIVHECSMCRKMKRPVVMHCETCDLFLCEIHTGTHLDDNEDHEVEPAAQSQPVNMCLKHSKKEIEFYCTICRVCVCSSCCILDHPGHSFKSVHDAFNEMKSSFDPDLSRLDVVCGEIALAVNQLNAVEVELERKESDISFTIRNSFFQIRAAVDAREEALMSSLPSKRLAVTFHKHQLGHSSFMYRPEPNLSGISLNHRILWIVCHLVS